MTKRSKEEIEKDIKWVLEEKVKPAVAQHNGVINFLSKNNINLKRVNEIVKGNTIFGDYVFQTEMVDGIKTRTSDEVIERYKKII